MPQTVEVTTYAFSELSDDAKSHARDKWREGMSGDNAFAEYVTDTLVTAAKALGFDLDTQTVRLMGGGTRQEPDVSWSGFWSQGDGASFAASYSYSKNAKGKLALEFDGSEPELMSIAQALQDVQRRHFYGLSATITKSGRYSHSHTMSADVSTARDYFLGEADEEIVLQAARDLADWYYHKLEQAYDFETSDDAVSENIEANEMRFTEAGDIF